MTKSLQQSFLIHAGLILLFAVLITTLKNSQAPQFDKIKIQIKEAPLENITPQKEITEPVVNLKQKPLEQKIEKIQKKVFGISKDTLTTAAPGAGAGVEIKAGNTVAKEIDQDKLDPNDEGSLPIPSEEYLVTQMPKIKKEFRISYPSEAKSKNIEGVVLMDLLIDDKGKVRDVQFVSGPGYGLNEAAVKALRQFEFSPALIDKKTVAVKIRYGYRFVLN